jgi:hypothetical protein
LVFEQVELTEQAKEALYDLLGSEELKRLSSQLVICARQVQGADQH